MINEVNFLAGFLGFKQIHCILNLLAYAYESTNLIQKCNAEQ